MRISTEELNYHFRHDATEGKLYRRFSRAGSPAGKEAGSIKDTGYRALRVRGLYIATHRAIYQMVHGALEDGLDIDHIDGDRLNNKIENLRTVTRGENGKNKRLPRTNSSGIIGVNWSKPHSKWKAVIKHNQHIYYLGLYTSKEEAAKVRMEAAIRFGFHPNHGSVLH